MSQSSRGILDRLSDHFEHVAAELSKSFQAASDKHAGTPEAIATDREQSLRQVMRRFFPEPFKVIEGSDLRQLRRPVGIDRLCHLCR